MRNKLLLTSVLLATLAIALLGLAYASGRMQRPGLRSCVLTQKILAGDKEVATSTTYYSSTGDWRTLEVSSKSGKTKEYGLIVGLGAVRYRASDDVLSRLPFAPATPSFGNGITAENLAKSPQYVGRVRVGDLDTYMMREYDPNGKVASEAYMIPGLPSPVKLVLYDNVTGQPFSVKDFVSIEFREPTRDELMQRYEGKRVIDEPDPRQR